MFRLHFLFLLHTSSVRAANAVAKLYSWTRPGSSETSRDYAKLLKLNRLTQRKESTRCKWVDIVSLQCMFGEKKKCDSAYIDVTPGSGLMFGD